MLRNFRFWKREAFSICWRVANEARRSLAGVGAGACCGAEPVAAVVTATTATSAINQ